MVCIIEPHGDDALISSFTLLHTLSSMSEPVKLITLSERSSEGLREYFPDFDIQFKDLEDVNYRYKPKIDTHEINRLYKSGCHVSSHVRGKCIDGVPTPVKVQAELQITRLKMELTESCSLDNLWVVPLGLDHPYHIIVSYMMDTISPNTIYYIEKPYLSKRYIRQVVSDQEILSVDTHVRISVQYSEALKDLKSKIFREVYPTEQSLLRFTRDSVLSDDDEYLVPRHLTDDFTDMLRRSDLKYTVYVGGKIYNENHDGDQPEGSTLSMG